MALEEHSTSRASAYLYVKLGESHEQSVSQADQQPAGIQTADVRRGHHDDVGDAAEEAGRPDGSPPPEDGGDGTGAARAQESTERHQGRNPLLAVRRDVPAARDVLVYLAVDLK